MGEENPSTGKILTPEQRKAKIDAAREGRPQPTFYKKDHSYLDQIGGFFNDLGSGVYDAGSKAWKSLGFGSGLTPGGTAPPISRTTPNRFQPSVTRTTSPRLDAWGAKKTPPSHQPRTRPLTPLEQKELEKLYDKIPFDQASQSLQLSAFPKDSSAPRAKRRAEGEDLYLALERRRLRKLSRLLF